jgi:inner membrane protein involved in colicin E2 resistance
MDMKVEKQRQGFLTAWLVTLIAGNSLAIVTNLLAVLAFSEDFHIDAPWVFMVLIVGGILNIFFAIALFRWKKWGFYGFIATTILAFLVSSSWGTSRMQAYCGLIGLVVLFAALKTGNENKGWPQLE